MDQKRKRVMKLMVNQNKIFVPHELKKVEIDVEKRIFRINGEDFGKSCEYFTISCTAGGEDRFWEIHMSVGTEMCFANYDPDGKKTHDRTISNAVKEC